MIFLIANSLAQVAITKNLLCSCNMLCEFTSTDTIHRTVAKLNEHAKPKFKNKRKNLQLDELN